MTITKKRDIVTILIAESFRYSRLDFPHESKLQMEAAKEIQKLREVVKKLELQLDIYRREMRKSNNENSR